MLTVNISKTFLEQLPIKNTSDSKKREFVQLVDKIINCKKELEKLSNKITAETKNLKDKIGSLDKEINQEVYRIYGLTEKEIEILEKNL